MQKSFVPDHWQVNVGGVSVWSYFRFDHNDLPKSQYIPKAKFGLVDVVYFIKLLLLRFSNAEIIIFLAARNDLFSLIQSPPFDKKNVIFLREDGHDIAGNVFFIEAFRFIFRKFSPVFFNRALKNLEAQLLYNNIDIDKHRTNMKSAIGDYYFNKLLSYFLKGKKIYFSNCVVPKIERSHALSNAIEIQHGVIHQAHPDYANVPKGIFNIPLLCWGEFWLKKIKTINFGGEVIVGPSPVAASIIEKHNNSICFFTTLNDEVSNKIVASLPKLKNFDVLIQRHPRDQYNYDFSEYTNVTACKGLSPLEVKWPIMHDSTFCYVCAKNNKVFIYLANHSENKVEVIERLYDKYNAIHQKDYYIAYSTQDVINLLQKFNDSY